MAMASFTYSKLPSESDTTRMLRLLPHKESKAQIRGELIDYDLSDTDGRSHLYEALSYVWYDDDGSSDREPRAIILNDCIFSVTKNLYAALLRLRNHRFVRVLWIDAICINQSNDDEKEKQIPLMRTIYAQANCVVVWLGEARNYSDEAFERLRSVTDRTAKSIMGGFDEREMLSVCGMLLQRKWFRRIWVLQEVGVARCISIMCGQTEMSGDAFCKGFTGLEPIGFRSLSHVRPVIHMMRNAILRPKYWPASRGKLSLGELIDMYQSHQATVHHDKVYALLGLCADDPETSALKPNYALPWNDVLRQVTTYVFGEKCLVQTWPGRDIAVIKGKGWILGHVHWVGESSDDGQLDIKIELNETANWVSDLSHRKAQWRCRAPQALIQAGDIICLLQGTSKPSIIRLCGDHFEMVMTTITPRGIYGEVFDLKLEEWHSTIGFLYDILLTWRIPRNGEYYDIELPEPVELMNIVPEYQECPYEAKSRSYNMVLTVNNIALTILERRTRLGRSALGNIVFQCTENFPFSEGVIKATKAVTESTERLGYEYGCIALFMGYRGNNLPITEDVVKAAVSAYHAGTTLRLLIQHYGKSLPITEDVIKEAAMHGEPKTLQFLLDYRGNTLPMSDDMVKTVAKNCRPENLSLLLQYQHKSIPNCKEGETQHRSLLAHWFFSTSLFFKSLLPSV